MSKISDEQIDVMLAGLEGVTPGPWKSVSEPNYENGYVYTSVQPETPDTSTMRHLAMASGEHHICRMTHTPMERKFRHYRIDAAHIARCDPDAMRSILTELRALRSGGEEKNGVGVKPLEWHGPDMHGEIHARSVLCVYSILSKQPNGHWLTEVGGYHSSVEAAKAAAQADYERRILSALTNTDLSLRAENERLREVVSKCADALGNGAFIGPKASVEFMEKLPVEITSVITKSKEKLEEAAKVLEPLAAYIKARDDSDPDMPDDAPAVSYSAELRGPVVAATIGDFRAARSFLANLKGAE